MGVTKSAGRLSGLIRCVGCPCSSSSQCLAGYSYGELRIGLAKKSFSTGNLSGLVRYRPFGWVDSRYQPLEQRLGHLSTRVGIVNPCLVFPWLHDGRRWILPPASAGTTAFSHNHAQHDHVQSPTGPLCVRDTAWSCRNSRAWLFPVSFAWAKARILTPADCQSPEVGVLMSSDGLQVTLEMGWHQACNLPDAYSRRSG